MAKSIEKTIREIAQKQAEEKHQQIIKEMEEKLEADIENVNKVLELIENHTIYYKNNDYKYVLVTPDLFYKHYMDIDNNKYRAKGIFFKEEKGWNRHYSYIEVNGYRYYYFEDLLNKYEEDLRKCAEQTYYQFEQLREQQNKFKELKEQEPKIKKMIEEFIEFRKQLEIDLDSVEI